MPSRQSGVGRALFLARVVLGLSILRDAARGLALFTIALAVGLAALLAALALSAGAPPAGAATGLGLVAAAAAGSLAHVLAFRRYRRRQAEDFARAARRLGEEKTAFSELRRACGRLALAIERAVPEILAEDETSESGSAERGRTAGGPPDARGQRLAGRLMRIARAAAFLGGTDLELRRLALAGPCAEVIEQYRRLAGPDQEVLYIEDGGGDWLAAPIDRPLFVLLVQELLDNVLEHAGDWNRITVTTEPVADAIVLRVRDDGRGIASETIREILAGSAPAYRGGLGLPIVRAIVEAHGGTFRLESHPGHGTNVSLRFPTHA